MAETQAMEFRATARWVRVSPQKARLVLDLIKGRRVEEALNTLAFANKRIAERVYKLVRSALDNANHLSLEQGLDVDLDNLYVKHAVANDGPRMKRIRPAPQGRAYRYQRRMSHIEVSLAEKLRADGSAVPRTPRRPGAAGKHGQQKHAPKTGMPKRSWRDALSRPWPGKKK